MNILKCLIFSVYLLFVFADISPDGCSDNKNGQYKGSDICINDNNTIMKEDSVEYYGVLKTKDLKSLNFEILHDLKEKDTLFLCLGETLSDIFIIDRKNTDVNNVLTFRAKHADYDAGYMIITVFDKVVSGKIMVPESKARYSIKMDNKNVIVKDISKEERDEIIIDSVLIPPNKP